MQALHISLVGLTCLCDPCYKYLLVIRSRDMSLNVYAEFDARRKAYDAGLADKQDIVKIEDKIKKRLLE